MKQIEIVQTIVSINIKTDISQNLSDVNRYQRYVVLCS